MSASHELRDPRSFADDLDCIVRIGTTWIGRDPTVVAESILDVLLKALDLDFICMRLDEAAHSFARCSETFGPHSPEDLLKNCKTWPQTEPQTPPSVIVVDGVTLAVAHAPLGVVASIGKLVAGSRRCGFPSEHERLIMSFAASQSTVALRELHDQAKRQHPVDLQQDGSSKEERTENERHLRYFVDNLPVAAWCTASDGFAEFFNQHHFDYVGRTFEDLRGLGFLSQFHPDDLPRLLEGWQSMMENRRGGEHEGRVRRADGEYRWNLMRTNPLLDKEGQVIKWYGINTDIEDRKRSEDALRSAERRLAASEKNLNLIIDSLPVLIWASPEDGSSDYVNKRYLEYVGLPEEEILGWGFTRVFHPDDTGPMIARWKEQLHLDFAVNQSRIRRYDGEYRWFYFAGQKFTDANGSIRWFGVSLDIENLKRTEEALRASEEALRVSERRLQQIVNTIPALAWSADPDGRADFLNKHYLDYLGLSLEDALGDGWFSSVHPDDVAQLANAWQAMLTAGVGGDFEARLRRSDGQYRRFLFRSNPFCDDTGRVSKWFGINLDIEDRRVAEEMLRDSQDELARVARVTTMGEIAVSIAHEVNQPLMAIVTNAGTCLRWLEDDRFDVSKARQAVERISRAGHRAGDIIASIRSMAQKTLPKNTVMQLCELVKDVLVLLRGELRRTGLRATLECPEPEPEVMGDRTQLQQVVLNLIMNGAEAMSSEPKSRRDLCVRVSYANEHSACVTVSDTGVGFDPSIADRLFDPFYTTKPGGMGMGLSICRSIVESHGGRIWASQNHPFGSTFHFTVPLARKVDRDGQRS